MDDETIREIADGLALFQEHRPQSGEDWVAVAERFISDGGDTSQSSPLFAAVVLAVSARNAVRHEARIAEMPLAIGVLRSIADSAWNTGRSEPISVQDYARRALDVIGDPA